MIESTAVEQELEAFVNGWEDDNSAVRQGFLDLYRHVRALAGVTLDFVGRPGVSFLAPATGRVSAAGRIFRHYRCHR